MVPPLSLTSFSGSHLVNAVRLRCAKEVSWMSTADACSANLPGACRPDPHSHLQHVQVAAGPDVGTGRRVWSSLCHQGKRAERMELGGLWHKVRV